MTFIEELKALTAELERLNARNIELQESRGLTPGSGVPFVVVGEPDPELAQHIAEWEEYHRRDAEFKERHKNHIPGTP